MSDVIDKRTALQRIVGLEKSVQALAGNDRFLVEGSNKAFALVEQRIDVLEKIANALTAAFGHIIVGDNQTDEEKDINGRNVVEIILKRQVMADSSKRAEAEKAAIAGALAGGNIKVDPSVTENSIVVGREFLKDGTTIRHPGWEQLMMMEIKQEMKDLLVGKVVGDKIEIPAGSFEILEIYGFSNDPVSVPSFSTAPAAEGAVSEATVSDPAELPEAAEEDADKALEEYLSTTDTTTVAAN